MAKANGNKNASATVGGADAVTDTVAATTATDTVEGGVQTEGAAVNGQEAQPIPPVSEATQGESPAAVESESPVGSEPDEIEGYWVRAVPKQGFRRAGISIPHEGTGFGLGVLTDEQLEALRAEQNVVVEECTFSDGIRN